MEVMTLGWRTDLLARRLGGSAIEDRGDHLVVRTPHNPGFWWGNCLVLAALPAPNALTRWESVFAAAFPEATHRAFGVDVDVTGRSREDLADWPGLERELDVALTAQTLREPAGRPGVVRPLAGDDDWAQAFALRIVCRHPNEPPDDAATFERARIAEQRGVVERGDAMWFGNFDAGRLVAACGMLLDRRGLGRYQTVETHPDHRRRGFARQVVYDAGRAAIEEHGVRSLVILADLDYVAADLYRSIGFTDVEQHVQWFRPATATAGG